MSSRAQPLVAALVAGFFLLGSSPADESKPAPATGKDLYGDSLPEGAVARLGTIRFRQPPVQLIALSRDGKMLATTCEADHFIRLCNVEDGREIRRIRAIETDPEKDSTPDFVSCLLFSADGKTLYSGSRWKGHLRQWSVESGKEVRSFPSLVQVSPLALAPNGKTMAGVSSNSRLWWLTTDTGKVLQELTLRDDIRAISFFAKGKTLAAGTRSGVRFFDVVTGKEVRHVAPKLQIRDLAASPDDKVLAAAVDSTVRRWDLANGEELPSFPAKEFTSWVAFVPDGKWLVSSDQFSVIQFWDLASRKDHYQIRSAGHLTNSRPFDISRDGKTLAYSFKTGIGFWNISQKRNVDMPGHQGRISALFFAPDGRTLASGSWDNTVRIWDRTSGKELKRWQLPGGDFTGITGLSYSPDGRRLAAAGDDGAVRLWDTETAKELAPLSTRPNVSHWPDRSREVAYSPDGKFLIALGERSIRIWETAGAKELPTIKVDSIQQGHTFEKLAISPDSKVLAVGLSGGSPKVLVHDLVGEGKPRLLDLGGRGRLYQLAFSPDGRMLALGGNFYPNFPNTDVSYMLELRETVTGALRWRIPGKNAVSALAFAPDHRTLILALRSGDLRRPVSDVMFWDLEEIGRINGHYHTVSQLAVSPDGRWLATGSEDSTVLIWDLAKLVPRKPARKLSARELNDLFTDLASDDGPRAYRATRVLAAGGSKTVAFLNDILQRLVKGAEAKRIAGLVVQLEKSEFALRQQAQQKLAELGEFAEPALQQALQEKPSLEFRRRAEKLIAQMGSTRWRLLRAVEVLEVIGTPEARRTLEVIVQGPPHAALTREANKALGRLNGPEAPKPID
jgi:WD40 repeat protein